MDKLDELQAILEDPFRIYADLTERQRQAMKWSAYGKSREQIGELMGISPRTVDTHLQRGSNRAGLKMTNLRSRLIRMLLDVIEREDD